MTTTVVSRIGSNFPTGRDFATIQDWANSLNGLDLIVADQIQRGECYNDSEFTAAGAVVDFSGVGVTTDATHYVELTTAVGQSFRDQAGVRTNPLYYDATKGVGLRSTTSGYTMFNIGNCAIHINNIQIAGDAGTSGTMLGGGSIISTLFENCIFSGTEIATQGGTHIFRNCAFINFLGPFTRMMALISSSTSMEFHFCTLVAPAGGTPIAYVMYNDTAAPLFKNCAFFGATTDYVTGGVTPTFITCAGDLGSPPTGVTGSLVYADQFVSTTNDFRQKAGSFFQGAATADATNGATDISGLARPQGVNWDIGAWELATVVSSTVIMGQAVF